MSDQITYLPLSALREHPDNPRKAFDPAALLDLAESIKANGVLQPIVVRPLGDMQTDIEHRYELVFGHRRIRACALLPEYQDDTLRMPCIVREMSDDDVAVAQVAENLQRADVSAMEEADALAVLHKGRRLPADEIAQKIGKSKSFVYNRLKLSAASAALREAVTTGGLSPETAVEIARLRGDKQQQLGLARCKLHDGWMSQRQAKEAVRAMFTCTLAAAQFDPTDANLVRFASACAGCSKLSKNDPGLAELGADVCTDPQCYGDKQRAHTIKLLPAIKAQGMKVIDGDEAAEIWSHGAQMPHGYWDVDDEHLVQGWYGGKYQQMTLDEAQAKLDEMKAGYPAVTKVAIVAPDGESVGVYVTQADRRALNHAFDNAVRAAEATSTPSAAARAANGGAHGGGGEPDGMEPDGLDTADWTEAERAVLDDKALSLVRTAVLAAAVCAPRTVEDLRDMCRAQLAWAGDLEPGLTLVGGRAACDAARDRADDDDEKFDEDDWTRGWINTATPDTLAAVLLTAALAEVLPTHLNQRCAAALAHGKARQVVATAERFGIDVLAAARPNRDVGAGDAGGSDATAGAVVGDLFGADA